eukprot:CAMPEP_0116842350 /NCGR_PEP_ID=MMETSP0418-20121206/11462_1 /TAXON_ID=1158023 /ORGANISM="Astrosyne radiata, Strain 13vi08-1A" /LENGTH=289 /DNA_ID=CAMNT_0004472939 /DNA_START=51 /DNA_END=920 /DNA_ORIENTATION=-
MSITYEEALATLESMFGSPWNRDSLDTVLRHFEGHMENTVDCILQHGQGDPQTLIAQLKSGTVPQQQGGSTGGGGGGESMDEELARQLANEEERTPTAAPSRSRPKPPAAAPAAAPKPKGRGTPTELPPDFLRVPGRKPGAGTNMVDTDEALARMLQDELFSQELANNPEFAHLAQGRPRTSGGVPIAPGARNQNRRVGELPSRSNVPPPQQEGPNIMEKLTELGETTKRRLQLMAAQFTANNRFGRNNQQAPSSGIGNNAAAERRGLLDDDDDEGLEMEVSFATKKDT